MYSFFPLLMLKFNWFSSDNPRCRPVSTALVVFSYNGKKKMVLCNSVDLKIGFCIAFLPKPAFLQKMSRAVVARKAGRLNPSQAKVVECKTKNFRNNLLHMALVGMVGTHPESHNATASNSICHPHQADTADKFLPGSVKDEKRVAPTRIPVLLIVSKPALEA